MKLSLKAKTLISIALFVVVFAVLITLASFFDFQISQILTKHALPEGEYYATDFFGVLFETIGSQPIYLFAAFAFCVLFWFFLKVWTKKPYNILIAIACAVGVVAAFYVAIKDVFDYVFEHVCARIDMSEFEAVVQFGRGPVVVGLELFVSALLSVSAIFATKHFKQDTLKKLAKLCLAAAIAVAVSNALIALVKGPVGRMRYRAINSTLGKNLIEQGNVAGFTPWYIANGQPNEGILQGFIDNYSVHDAFKSFPSGHTCAAATVYAVLLVPDLFEFKHQKLAKVLCWIAPVLLVAVVAISRIVCGAHYMSDVTFGGTITFVCMLIAREVLVCKGSHFFALFPQLKRQKSDADETVAEYSVDGDVEDSASDETSCESDDLSVSVNDDEQTVVAVDE